MTIITNESKEIPEKFIKHILTQVVSETASPEENYCAIIKQVWDQASKPGSDIRDDITSYVTSLDAINAKIGRIRSVIRNTLSKRQLEAPAKFLWATRNAFTVVGVFKNEAASYASPRWVRLQVADLAELSRNKYSDPAIGVNSPSGTTMAMIPSSWLRLSDGEISKMVRREVERLADDTKASELRKLNDEKKALEKRLADVQNKMATVKAQKKTT